MPISTVGFLPLRFRPDSPLGRWPSLLRFRGRGHPADEPGLSRLCAVVHPVRYLDVNDLNPVEGRLTDEVADPPHAKCATRLLVTQSEQRNLGVRAEFLGGGNRI